MNNKDHSEEIIKKLVLKSELEKPNEAFTDNIMQKIQEEHQVETVNADPVFFSSQWLLIIVPCVVLALGSLYYFRNDFTGIFNIDFLTQTFVPYIKALFSKGSDVMSKQEFSPILIIVIISVSSLMVIDRFFHAGRKMKSYLFTI